MCGIEKHDLISIRVALMYFFHKCVLYYHQHGKDGQMNTEALFLNIYNYLDSKSKSEMAKNIILNTQKNQTTDKSKYIYKVVQQYGASFGQRFATLYLYKFQRAQQYERDIKLLIKESKRQIYMPARENIPSNYYINLFYMLNNYYKMLEKIVMSMGDETCQLNAVAAQSFLKFIKSKRNECPPIENLEIIDEIFYKKMD